MVDIGKHRIRNIIEDSEKSGFTSKLNEKILKEKKSDGFFTNKTKKLITLLKSIFKAFDHGKNVGKKVGALEKPVNDKTIIDDDDRGIPATLWVLKLLFGKSGAVQQMLAKFTFFNSEYRSLKKGMREILGAYKATKLDAKNEAMEKDADRNFKLYEFKVNFCIEKIEDIINSVLIPFFFYRSPLPGEIESCGFDTIAVGIGLSKQLKEDFERFRETFINGRLDFKKLENFARNIPTYKVFTEQIKSFTKSVDYLFNFAWHRGCNNNLIYSGFSNIYYYISYINHTLIDYFDKIKKTKVKLDGNFRQLHNFLTLIKKKPIISYYLSKQSDKFKKCDNKAEFIKSIEYQNAFLCNIILWLSVPKVPVIDEKILDEGSSEAKRLQKDIEKKQSELKQVEEETTNKESSDSDKTEFQQELDNLIEKNKKIEEETDKIKKEHAKFMEEQKLKIKETDRRIEESAKEIEEQELKIKETDRRIEESAKEIEEQELKIKEQAELRIKEQAELRISVLKKGKELWDAIHYGWENFIMELRASIGMLKESDRAFIEGSLKLTGKRVESAKKILDEMKAKENYEEMEKNREFVNGFDSSFVEQYDKKLDEVEESLNESFYRAGEIILQWVIENKEEIVKILKEASENKEETVEILEEASELRKEFDEELEEIKKNVEQNKESNNEYKMLIEEHLELVDKKSTNANLELEESKKELEADKKELENTNKEIEELRKKLEENNKEYSGKSTERNEKSFKEIEEMKTKIEEINENLKETVEERKESSKKLEESKGEITEAIKFLEKNKEEIKAEKMSFEEKRKFFEGKKERN